METLQNAQSNQVSEQNASNNRFFNIIDQE